MSNHIKIIVFLSTIISLKTTVHAAGESVQYGTTNSSRGGPVFIPLQEGEGKYDAIVQDGTYECTLTNVSFSGHTKLGGIKNEHNDSFSSLDLATISVITIIDPFYQSERYINQEFVCADVTSLTGAVEQSLLIPRNVIIGGIDKKTQSEKVWFLKDLAQISISKSDTFKIFAPHTPSSRRYLRTRAAKKIPSKTTLPENHVHVEQPSSVKVQTETTQKTLPEWPTPVAEKTIPDRTLRESFMAIIDTIIEFIKLILIKIWKFIKW